MAAAKQPVVQQTVELPGSGRLVYKSDKKWYYQVVSGTVVVSESVVTASEAKRLQAGTPAERGAVSPGGGQPSRVTERPSTPSVEAQITALEKLKPNSSGIYVYNGNELTKTQYQNELKRLRNILGEREVAAGQASRTQSQVVQAERDKLVQYIADFNQQLKFAQTIVDNSTDTAAVKRASDWVKKLTLDQRTLTGFLKTIDDTGRLPVSYVLPEIPTPQDIQKTSPPSISSVGPTGAAATTTLPGPAGAMATIPVVPRQPSTGPISAAGRGEAGIGAPARTGEVVSTPFGTYRRKPDGEFEPVYKDASGQWQVGFGPAGGAGTTPAGQPPAAGGTVSGGGAGGGAVGGTTTGTVPPAGATGTTGTQVPADWEQAAREAYGAWFDAIRNIPEMRDFINQLMTGPELSEAQFMAKLQQTNWWRTTTAAARDFARRQVEDPATLQTQIDNQVAALRQEAMSRGIRLPDAELVKAATDQIKFGWSDQVTLDYIGGKALGTTEGVANLRSGFYGQQIRETAAKYGVPMSDTTLNKWVADVATGQQNIQSFEAYARDLAKNLFPALAGGFDRGLSFPEMTAPYAQFASQILEIPSDTIDFTRPEWARAFTARDQKGEQRQMSYGEWFDYLRTDQRFGWEFTDQARSQAFSVANDLGRMFGRSA